MSGSKSVASAGIFSLNFACCSGTNPSGFNLAWIDELKYVSAWVRWQAVLRASSAHKQEGVCPMARARRRSWLMLFALWTSSVNQVRAPSPLHMDLFAKGCMEKQGCYYIQQHI